MQIIAGEHLETGLRKRDGSFALTDVLPWLESLLGALEYLHSQQPPIIHRDIKPANLKLTPDGEIVLLDFGLANGAVGTEETTAAPSVAGDTAPYSPLEQIDRTETDARSDVYALGATVSHLLTGVAPPNGLAHASALMNREPDPLLDALAVRPKIPPALGAVLARACCRWQRCRRRGRRGPTGQRHRRLPARSDPWSHLLRRRPCPERPTGAAMWRSHRRPCVEGAFGERWAPLRSSCSW